MSVAIFPNSSYFIAYGASPTFFEEIRLASLRHQARIYACRSKSEFFEALSIIRVPSGVFLDCSGFSDKDLHAMVIEVGKLKLSQSCFFVEKAIALEGVPYMHTVLVPAGAKSQFWSVEIDKYMKRLVPPKLDQMILDCANSIVPRFFSSIKNFKPAAYAMEDPDYVLNFALSAGDVIGQYLAWVKWDEICKMLPDLPASRSGDKILDVLRESMNQCAGLLVQAVVRMYPDSKMRIGLPTGFDLMKVPKIESVKYFPSAHIIEEQGRIGISIGLVDLSHKPIFDLSTYAPAESEGDVEFL